MKCVESPVTLCLAWYHNEESGEVVKVRCADFFSEHRSDGSNVHAYSGPGGCRGKARIGMHFELYIPYKLQHISICFSRRDPI